MKKSMAQIGIRRKAVNDFIEEEELSKIMHEEEKKNTNSKVVAYSIVKIKKRGSHKNAVCLNS